MNNFWTLTGFEFKKILQRKVFWGSILICTGSVAVLLFSSINEGSFRHTALSNVSPYEAMNLDRDAILSNRGHITPELLSKAILANKEMISDKSNYTVDEYGTTLKDEAYIKYILPYESIINLLNVVYENDPDWISSDSFGLFTVNSEKSIDNLTPDMVLNFEEDLQNFTRATLLRKDGLSDSEINKNMELIDQLKLPLYHDYYGGYRAYISSSKGLALTVLFLILILLAPLFSNEYDEQTQQLILCSKNGKKSLCAAKLFISLSISLVSSILIMGISWLLFLTIFGFEGKSVNIQVMNPGCTYPFTLFEACLLHFISVIMASLLFGAFITFMSAKVKRKNFTVVVIGTLFIIIPMFIWMPLKSSRFLYNILQLIPVNAITFGFDLHFYDVFGILFPPYQFKWIISGILMVVFSALAVRSFNNHQTS